MLNTVKFIELLIAEGFTHLVVVPCSYAKNLINGSINNKQKFLMFHALAKLLLVQ